MLAGRSGVETSSLVHLSSHVRVVRFLGVSHSEGRTRTLTDHSYLDVHICRHAIPDVWHTVPLDQEFH